MALRRHSHHVFPLGRQRPDFGHHCTPAGWAGGNAPRHAQRRTTILVQIDGQADAVALRVVNQGHTIPTEHLPYLFHRFYRADAARSNAARNHGLGLAIVAAIARMHGGRTVAESNGGVTSIGLTVPDPFKPSAPHPEAATR